MPDPIFDRVRPSGKAIDSECSFCVRLGFFSYWPVKDDEYAGQNGRFIVGALREYVTSDRSRCGRTALSESRKHEQ
jgi:hypothetical protein